jgi:hypothetical protein
MLRQESLARWYVMLIYILVDYRLVLQYSNTTMNQKKKFPAYTCLMSLKKCLIES